VRREERQLDERRAGVAAKGIRLVCPVERAGPASEAVELVLRALVIAQDGFEP
jgi:hypothetical protein